MDQCPPATTARFKNSFFPYCKKHWDLLPADIRSINTYGKFKSILQQSVRPTKQYVFGITDVSGLKFLIQLRVDLNDFRVHCFLYGFTNCHSPICVCGTENESTSHFRHRCPRFTNQRNELYTKIRSLDAGDSLFSLPSDDFTTALLYGMNTLTTTKTNLS